MTHEKTNHLLSRLQGVKQDKPNHWMALCPSHEDTEPSLSITEESDRILINCQASAHCSFNSILKVIGLQSKDLFFSDNGKKQHRQSRKVVKETPWDICDCSGQVIAQHVRLDYSDGSKSFKWRRNGRDSLDGLKVKDIPLYGLKWLIDEPDDSTRDIILVEGEKAADVLHSAGYLVLGTVCGASVCPSEETLMMLLGRKVRIILWPDADDPGKHHMQMIARQLHDMGIECYTLNWPEAPDKGDAADFLQTGGDVKSLLKNNIRISPLSVDLASERIKNVSESVSETDEGVSNVSKTEVLEWVKDSSGWFSYEELDREFNIKSPSDKTRRRIIIKRLRDDGIIEAHPRDNKLYRYKNVAVRLIDFKAGGKRQPLTIRYPFGVERYFKTYPGNIIALAGAADAGKTAFLLNFVRMNMEDFSIFYQSSEMGQEELASRLQNFEGIDLEDWNFTAEERSRDFADVIRPDCINIIDYLELAGDFYSVADHMRQIHDRLASGIAIVALQKKRGAELGRGGDFGLEKPRLYLSMDRGEVTIQKCKNWVNHEENPNRMKIGFKIVRGCKFTVTEDWNKESQ